MAAAVADEGAWPLPWSTGSIRSSLLRSASAAATGWPLPLAAGAACALAACSMLDDAMPGSKAARAWASPPTVDLPSVAAAAWGTAKSLLMPTGAASPPLLEPVAASQPASCSSSAKEHGGRPRHAEVKLQGRSYSVEYRGPQTADGLGRLVVAPRGPEAPTSRDLDELLDTVGTLADVHMQGTNCVLIFDVSQMVRPSVFTASGFVRVLRERGLPTALRDNTQAFAIVCQPGPWVNAGIDAAMAILQPQTVPIRTTSRERADALLAERFQE